MSHECDEMQALVSGYVDDELTAEERKRLESHLERCAECRRELDQLRLVARATSNLHIKTPPEEVWDHFLDDVYNRLERRVGWFAFWVGATALLLFGLYHYIVDPWASPMNKALIGLPLAGLFVLFVSVLRQRMFIAKTDRYSREVRR
jgi:hypothetical protein